MGIKVKNLDHHIVRLRSNGTLTTGLHKSSDRAQVNGWVAAIAAKVMDAGTGVTHTTVDINKNGTSIFDSANLTLNSTTGVVSLGALASDPVTVAVGDIISLDIDGISTAPINLSVDLLVSSRIPAGSTRIHQTFSEVL